jgi:hypothetical protein
MIIDVKMYTAECDVCGHHCEFGDYSCYADKSSVREEASDSGWHFTSDGKCYCEDCHTINDNDELVLKQNTNNQPHG